MSRLRYFFNVVISFVIFVLEFYTNFCPPPTPYHHHYFRNRPSLGYYYYYYLFFCFTLLLLFLRSSAPYPSLPNNPRYVQNCSIVPTAVHENTVVQFTLLAFLHWIVVLFLVNSTRTWFSRHPLKFSVSPLFEPPFHPSTTNNISRLVNGKPMRLKRNQYKSL